MSAAAAQPGRECRHAGGHPRQARADGGARLGGHAAQQIRKINHDLRRVPGHDGGRRRSAHVNAMYGILSCHRGNQRHAGEQRSPSVAARERPEADRKARAQCEQCNLDRHQGAKRQHPRCRAARRQRHAEQPRRDHDDAEHRQRQQLGDSAAGAEHQCGAESHEISGDVRGKQAVQRKIARRVDIAAIDAEQYGQGRFHG